MDLAVNSFLAGEWSPLMEGRTDLPEYYHSCRTLTNMVPLPSGGVQARPGFKFISQVETDSEFTRLGTFVYKKIQGYELEFGNLYFRVYKDGAKVADVEVTTTYTTAQLPYLRFMPTWDQLYVFSPDVTPRVITRTAHTTWTIADAGYTYGPFQTQNTGVTTITPSAVTGTINLTASVNTFNADHVGALFAFQHQVSEVYVADAFTLAEDTASSTLTRKGLWSLKISGNWSGLIKLQRSYDAGSTYFDVRTYSHPTLSTTAEIDEGEEVNDSVRYRLLGNVVGTADYELRFHNIWQTGIAKIATVVTAKSATATVINTLGGTIATTRWSEGSWSDYRGHPVCGAFYEERVWHASNAHQPQSIWASQTYKEAGDYITMKPGTEDDDALEYRLPIPGICWLLDAEYLLIGTDKGIWKMSGTNDTDSITPTNIKVRPQVGEGSSSLPPLKVANRAVYVGRGLNRVYMLDLLQNRTYQAVDMTQFASHICGTGIRDWAVMEEPYKIVWAVTSDGDLISMVQTGPQMIAWSRHETDGDFESVAVLPGDGAEDEVWVVVARVVDGSTIRCVEQMQKFDWGSDQRDAFLVDCGVSDDNGAAVAVTNVAIDEDNGRVTITAATHGFTDGDNVRFASLTKSTDLNTDVYTVYGGETNTFILKNSDASDYVDGSDFDDSGACTGTAEVVVSTLAVAHLEGEALAVMGDGVDIGPLTVDSGSITLGAWYNTVHAGLSYTYVAVPQRPEYRTGMGTTMGRKKKVTDIAMRVYKTGALGVGTDADDLQTVALTEAATSTVELLTGDTQGMVHPGGWNDDGTIHLQGESPMPMTVCAVMYSME